jgi:hypothetical protein
MRNKQLLRYSLASLSVMGAAFGVFLIACGDDDNVTPTPNEAGTNNETGTNPNPDGGGGGTDATTEAAPPVPNAKLQLVNAALDFGPDSQSGGLRVCFAIGATEAGAAIAPLPPLPDGKTNPAAPFPGVFIGTGGPVQGTGADLSGLVVVPYVMNAQRLFAKGLVRPDAGGGAGASCADILGNADAGAGATQGLDYWKLPAIPAGTLQKQKSYILILTGCTANVDAGATANCGSDFVPGPPGNGNLKVTVHEVDLTQPAANAIGTQFIHASQATASGIAPAPVLPGYITDPAMGLDGGFKGVTGDGGASPAVAVNSKSNLVQIQGVNFASDSFTFSPSSALFSRTLTQVSAASYGGAPPDGGDYRNGANFTFILVGEPQGAGARASHVIALPNNPTQETFKPNQ